MEIRFSKDVENMAITVHAAARFAGTTADITRTRYPHRIVRFTLWAATIEQHDKTIAKLFEIDPDAVVRTARAHYNGLADFEKQRGKANA